MPIIRQKRIYRSDIQNNPDKLYLFGDNDKRAGFGGQAAEFRGETNAIGVRTKWAPNNYPKSFFSDDHVETISIMLAQDLLPARRHLEKGGSVVIPEDGLGTGLSQLPQRAPKINARLLALLAELEGIGAKACAK